MAEAPASTLASAVEAVVEEIITRAMGIDGEGGRRRVRATCEMAIERNKAVGSFTVEIGGDDTKAETSPTREFGAVLTKERVPEDYIEMIKAHPSRKIKHPLDACIARNNPERRQMYLTTISHLDYHFDLEQDCLKQHAEKGYAEIGVRYTSNGVKKVFILPQDCHRQYAEKGYAEICIDHPDGSKKVYILPKPVA